MLNTTPTITSAIAHKIEAHVKNMISGLYEADCYVSIFAGTHTDTTSIVINFNANQGEEVDINEFIRGVESTYTCLLLSRTDKVVEFEFSTAYLLKLVESMEPNQTASEVKHTMYENGAIRDAGKKLIGFYDRADKTLVVDGYLETFHMMDEEHAMELIAALFK